MSVAERLIELAGGKVARAEQEIVTPFAAVMFHVHESDAGAGGKIECGHAGAIDVHGQIDERRPVGFLVCGDSQPGTPFWVKPS